MKTSRKSIAGIVTLLILIFVCDSRGQNPNDSGQSNEPVPLTKLSLIVTDESDHSVDDIRKEEIKIFEGKEEQTISLFVRDQRPIDFGIAIDSSGSFRQLMAPALTAMQIVIARKRPSDQVFIETFVSSDKIETLQDFTADKSLLLDAFKAIMIQEGQSAVIDALYLATDYMARHEQKEHRKALIVITDGEDRLSFYKRGDLIKLLRATSVQVFVIGIITQLSKDDRGIPPSPREAAEKLLRSVAEESGGRLFLPKSVGDLSKTIDEIVHDLNRQFVVGYQSTNLGRKTDFRKVDVKLVEAPGRDKWHVITPPGYYLYPPKPDSKSKEKKSP